MHLSLESLGKHLSVLGNMGNSNTIFGVVFVERIRLVNHTTSVVHNLLHFATCLPTMWALKRNHLRTTASTVLILTNKFYKTSDNDLDEEQ